MNEKKYVLNNQHTIPMIGLGTYKLKGSTGVEAIKNALSLGYRLLDTAYNYENEATVGKAMSESGVKRDEIVVTSKLPGRYHDFDLALQAIEESLYRLHVQSIDLYLIHWPNPKQNKYVEAWEALIEAQRRGLITSIGVSNFEVEHLEKLVEKTGVLPAVNQIEIHPFFNQEALVHYCQRKNIRVEAWSPMGGSRRHMEVMEDETLNQLAKKYGVSVSQIVLRWHIQRGIVPLPKSQSPIRQQENLDVFEFRLSDEDMKRIMALSRADGRVNQQDPHVYEEF